MNTVFLYHQLSDLAAASDRDGETPLQEAVLLVPSADVTTFTINADDIPGRYLSQALPPLLEDELAEPVNDLHLSPASHKKGQPLAVLVVKNHVMQEWVDTARTCGIAATAIYPDFYLLPDNTLYIDGDYAIVRLAGPQGFSGPVAEVLQLLPLMPDRQQLQLLYTGDRPAAVAALEFADTTARPAAPTTVDTNAINLQQGAFAVVKKRRNPYKAWLWPLAAAATLLVAIAVNLLLQQYFYKRDNTVLAEAVAADYQRVFGTAPPANWQAQPGYASAVATAQLNGDKLGHWRMLKELNLAISACRSCVIEELTINNATALLTVKQAGSEALLSQLNTSPVLTLEQRQTTANTITLKLKQAEA